MKITVASLNGTVSLKTLTPTIGSSSYTPLGFTASKSFSLLITKNSSQTTSDFWISDDSVTSFYGVNRNYTSGYALRDENSYYNAKIYYSMKDSNSSTDSTLYAEVVNITFSTISSWNGTVDN